MMKGASSASHRGVQALTNAELHEAHLASVFEALRDATTALADGDMEMLEVCLAGAGFELCCAMPERYTELAPDVWFGKGF